MGFIIIVHHHLGNMFGFFSEHLKQIQVNDAGLVNGN